MASSVLLSARCLFAMIPVCTRPLCRPVAPSARRTGSCRRVVWEGRHHAHRLRLRGGSAGLLHASAVFAAAVVMLLRLSQQRRRIGKASSVACADGDREVQEEQEKRVVRRIQLGADLGDVIVVDGATVASMDLFMKLNAVMVCVQAEKVEPTSTPGDIHCWMKPLVIGPFQIETRLTVTCNVEKSGHVNIRIEDIDLGMFNKMTGEVAFDPNLKPDSKVVNTITWHDNKAGGLEVAISAANTLMAPVPWWFPVSDRAIQQILNVFISQIVASTIKKVGKEIREGYSAWGASTSVYSDAASSGAVPRFAGGARQSIGRRSSARLCATMLKALGPGQRRRSPHDKPSVSMYESRNSGDMDTEPFDWFKHWYPVGIVATVDPTRPHKTQLLGMNIVIWNDGSTVDGQKQEGKWHVFEDSCPRGQDPLSEGCVAAGGNLLCSRCNEYSQLNLEQANGCNCDANCRSFPTKVVDSMIFVFPESGLSAWDEANKVKLPLIDELHDPLEKGRWSWVGQPAGARDFPCSWDLMLENTLDPAHFCGAHHNTFGNRYTDPGVYEYTENSTLDLEGGFELNGDMGNLKFRPPCLCIYRPQWSGMPFRDSVVIATYSVPTAPGVVRVTATVLQDQSVRCETTLATVAFSIYTLIPTWLQHVLSPIVLHQDAGILYNQSRNLREQGYRPRQDGSVDWRQLVYTPNTADKPVQYFRRWLRRAGGGVPWACADEVPQRGTEDIYETWHAHTEDCKYCSAAYRNIENVKYVSFAVVFVIFVFMPVSSERVWSAVFFAALACFLHAFNGLFLRYECSHADNN